jgi:HYDIN/CFA65/VesB family protein/pre-peptidase
MLHLEQLEPRCLLSIVISDTVSPSDDLEILFGDIGVGQTSPPEAVAIYNDGTSEARITTLEISGLHQDSFSLTQAKQMQLPPNCGPDEAVLIEINEIVNGEISDPLESDWYYFDAEENHVIIAGTSLGSIPDSELVVWTDYGDSLAQNVNMGYEEGSLVTFAAPYTGRYYIEVYGYEHSSAGTYRIGTIDAGQNVHEIDLTDEPTTITGYMDGHFAQDFEWFRFETPEYGTEIQISCMIENASLNLNIYNNFGVQEFESLIFESFSETVDITLYSEGYHYISLAPMVYGDMSHPFELSISKTGSLFHLEPDETAIVPVWFTPQSSDDLEASLLIETDADGGTEHEIALYGTGIPGDMTVENMEFPDLYYPDFIQTGKPLAISTDVFNAGPGLIFQNTSLRYYLSTDQTLDTDETLDTPVDVVLTDFDDQDSFDIIAPIYSEDRVNSTIAIDIPSVEIGTYYIIAVVDYDNLVTEVSDDNNILVSSPLYLDPFDTLLFDSIDDTSDRSLDFGKSSIQRVYPQQYVTIYNRSDEPVPVNDWFLGDGTEYAIRSAPNQQDNSGDDIILLPNDQPYKVWVEFVPQTFEAGGQPLVSDILYVTTEETQYEIDLNGTVTGADLVVIESSGAADDDQIEIAVTSPGEISAPVTFEILNNGDQDLWVKNLVMQNDTSSRFELDLPVDLNDPLSPGDSLAISVTFAPDRAGEFTDNIIITSNDRGDFKYTYQLSVSAISIEPVLTISEDVKLDGEDDCQLHFGWQPFDKGFETTVYLSNSADFNLAEAAGFPPESMLVITGWEFQDSAGVAFVTDQANDPLDDNDDITIAPGDTVELKVKFQAPSDQATTEPYFFSDTLTISGSDGDHAFSLSGHGASPSLNMINSDASVNANQTLVLDAAILDYNTVNTTATTVSDWFFIRGGNVEYTLSDIVVTDNIAAADRGFSIEILGNELDPDDDIFDLFDRPLPAGQNLCIDVKFNGDNLNPGNYTGQIVINVATTDPYVIDLSAAVVSPDIVLSDSSLNFNDVIEVNIGSSSSLPLTVSNHGDFDLVISDWAADDSQFYLDLDGELSIAPGESEELNVIYSPTLTGFTQANLTLISNDPDEFESDILLYGQSSGRPISIPTNIPYSFIDSDGDLVRVTIINGQGVLYLEGGERDNADISVLAVSGTTESSVVFISTTGKTNLGSILVDNEAGSGTASLSSIIAPGVTLEKEIFIEGSLGMLMIGDIVPGNSGIDASYITVNEPSLRPMTILAGNVADNVYFDLDGDLQTFQAKSFNSGILHANKMSLVQIYAGDLGADLISDGVGSGSINNVIVNGDITGNIRALSNIGMISSLSGGIDDNYIIAGDASLLSQGASEADLAGNINYIYARNGISGTVLALDNINSLNMPMGSFSGTVRAENIRSLNAACLDNALISVSDSIGTAYIRSDVIGSHILAGYDIGMDGQPGPGDIGVVNGDMNLFWFGGDFRESYVAIGVMTDPIYQSLFGYQMSGPPETSHHSANTTIFGGKVVTQPNQPSFGIYYDSHSGSTLNTNLLDISPNDSFEIRRTIYDFWLC